MLQSIRDGVYLIVFTEDSIIRPNAGSGAHEFMVCGMDPGERRVMLAGYNDDTLFGTFSVTYEKFRRAYQVGMDSEECKDFPILRVLSHNNCTGQDRDVTVKRIGRELRHMHESTTDRPSNASEPWFWCDTGRGPEASWRYGLKSYNLILPHVSALDSDPYLFDYRVFHFSCEFRKRLYKTFNVFSHLKGIDIHREAIALRKLLKLLEETRIKAFRILHGEDLPISEKCYIFEECRDAEQRVLNKLMVAL